jgi:hypothetical protein
MISQAHYNTVEPEGQFEALGALTGGLKRTPDFAKIQGKTIIPREPVDAKGAR